MQRPLEDQIESLRVRTLIAFDAAFDAESKDEVVTHLTNALRLVRSLTKLDNDLGAIASAMNETRAALSAKGWC